MTLSTSEQAQTFRLFLYLQVLDLLTTIAFLSRGIEEANPLVRLSMGLGAGTVPGLILVKTMAMLLGFFCLQSGKARALVVANRFFGCLVVWNLLALILQSGL